MISKFLKINFDEYEKDELKEIFINFSQDEEFFDSVFITSEKENKEFWEYLELMKKYFTPYELYESPKIYMLKTNEFNFEKILLCKNYKIVIGIEDLEKWDINILKKNIKYIIESNTELIFIVNNSLEQNNFINILDDYSKLLLENDNVLIVSFVEKNKKTINSKLRKYLLESNKIEIYNFDELLEEIYLENKLGDE